MSVERCALCVYKEELHLRVDALSECLWGLEEKERQQAAAFHKQIQQMQIFEAFGDVLAAQVALNLEIEIARCIYTSTICLFYNVNIIYIFIYTLCPLFILLYMYSLRLCLFYCIYIPQLVLCFLMYIYNVLFALWCICTSILCSFCAVCLF